MPELRREFTRSRMNKDLDERLIQPGEYRDALNIEVSTSETSDVGAIEASKGNSKITASSVFDGYTNPQCIGTARDSQNDKLYWFVTSDNKDAIMEYDIPNNIVSPIIVCVKATNNALQFSTSYRITAANVIDGLLFFTDNNSEPKKINIERFKSATAGDFDLHTQIYGGDVEEQYMTAIKKYPKTAPNLEISNTLRTGIVDSTYIDGNGDTFVDLDGATEPKAIGSEMTIYITGQPDYRVDDILRFSATDANKVYVARCRLKEILAKTTTQIQVELVLLSTSDEMLSVNATSWDVELEEGDSFFQDKFPRFAYRWKYNDNEYSAFSPFTGVAFIPDDEDFIYNVDEGHNVNMVNDVRKIALNSLDALPPDVDEIDILYKESNAPNVYVVKTLKNKQTSTTITSEQIEKTVEKNQTLRPYDNVPRKALAQEVIANRLVYGNYLQNYNFNEAVDIKLTHNPEVVEVNQPQPSAKSLRTYQVGVVYLDKYGRQSPVFTSTKASLNLDGTNSGRKNVLKAKVNSDYPDWATHYKYYIKENSNEYYNLAMDRYYSGERNNFWLSFPSSERNKVDLDTYLILKKQNAHDSAFDPDEYGIKAKKYKVLDISPSVPEFIGKKRVLIGSLTGTSGIDSGYLFPNTTVGHPKEGYRSFRVRGDVIGADDSELRDIAAGVGGGGSNEIKSTATNFVNSNKYIRIKDTNEINATNYYQIETITKYDAGGGADYNDSDDYYEFTLSKNLGADAVWIGTKDNRVSSLKIELWIEENTIDSEEFAGRFFVKLKRDDIVNDNIFGTSPTEFEQIAESQFRLIDFNDTDAATKTLTSHQAGNREKSDLQNDRPRRSNWSGAGFVIEHDLDQFGNKPTAAGPSAAGPVAFRAQEGNIFGPRVNPNSVNSKWTFDIAGVGPKKGNSTLTLRYVDYGKDQVFGGFAKSASTSPIQSDFNAKDKNGFKTTQQEDYNFHSRLKAKKGLFLSFAGDPQETKIKITHVDIAAGLNWHAKRGRGRSNNRCLRYTIKLETPITWSPLHVMTGGGDGGTLRVDNLGTTATIPFRLRNTETIKLWRKRVLDDHKDTDSPAIWETEPKPSITDLDLYHEASDAYPVADHGTEQALGTNRNGSKIWYNCFSFGNGVESDRVRDDFNGTRIDKGAVASTILDEPYAEERRKTSLIYSGLFNSKSGVNKLNQFIQAEKITKDINTVYGSIQKIHTRDDDLVVLCEDKTLKVLAQKDALYNADGDPQLLSTNQVLGQAFAYSGDYGISKNPESFASFGNRIYFSDKDRGKVFRLSGGRGGGDGLTEISAKGMADYFQDNLPSSDKLLGIFDEDTNAYHLTLKTPQNEDQTVSFKESVDGWPSKKSFIPEWGVSLNSKLYTFKNADLYEHKDEDTDRCNYYGDAYSATVDVIFNGNRNTIKKFKTLNYEGDPNWVATSVTTDQESGAGATFEAKENKYFTFIRHAKSSTTKVTITNGDNGNIIVPDPQSVEDVFGTTMSNTLTFVVQPKSGFKFDTAFTFGTITGGTTYIDSSTLAATVLSNGNMQITAELNDYKNPPEDLYITIPLVTSGHISSVNYTLAGVYSKTTSNCMVNDYSGGALINATSANGTSWTTSGSSNSNVTLLNAFVQPHTNYQFTTENLPEIIIGGAVDNYQVTGPTAIGNGYHIKVVGSIANQSLSDESIKVIANAESAVDLETNAIWGANISLEDFSKDEEEREITVHGSVGAQVVLNASVVSSTGSDLAIDLLDGNGFSTGNKTLTVGDEGKVRAVIKVTVNGTSAQRNVYVRLTPATDYVIVDSFDTIDGSDDNQVLYTIKQTLDVTITFAMQNVTNGNVTTGIAVDVLENKSLGAATTDAFTEIANTEDPQINYTGNIIHKLARDNSTDTQSSVVKVDDLNVTTDFLDADGANPYNSDSELIVLKYGTELKIGAASFHAPGSGRGSIQIPFDVVKYGTQDDTLTLKTAQVLELSKNLGASGTNKCEVTLTGAGSYIDSAISELAGSTFVSKADEDDIIFGYEVTFTASADGLYPSQLAAAYSSFSSNLTNNGSDATIALKEGYGDKFGRIRNDDIGIAMFRGEADGAITGTDTESATVTLTLNS